MTSFTFIQKQSKKNSAILSLCLFIAFLFSMQGFSQELANNSTSTVGVFAFEEETINYGTIQQNDNGIRSFKFTNRGRAPIVISKVKTSCGCTVPTYPKQAILPGESGVIEVKYATNRLGKFSKSLTVFSNADDAQKRLQIKGNVVKKQSKTIK